MKFLWILFALVLMLLPVLLISEAVTVEGKLSGWSAALGLLSVTLAGMRIPRRFPKAGRFLFWGCGVGALACLFFIIHRAPQGRSAGAAFTQVYLDGARFKRLGLSNLVPEVDQLLLGASLAKHLDPYIDEAQAGRLQGLIQEVYLEMRHDAEFVEAGSALGECYMDILPGPAAMDRFYRYVPKETGKEGGLPVLVFLHGSMGSFKGYSWVLKKVADEHRLAILAPEFGVGNWWWDEKCHWLDRLSEAIAADPALDATRMVLVGLSNGGTGMTRVLREKPDRFRGYVFFSAVIEPSVVGQSNFSWVRQTPVPVLFLHGEHDRRIPVAHVRSAAAFFQHAGFRVQLLTYPGEDHFLFFSQRDAVCHTLSSWLRDSGILAPAP